MLVVASVSEEHMVSICRASTLKMEVICFSEILVTTYKATWHHNPEDHNRYIRSCENLRFQIFDILVQVLFVKLIGIHLFNKFSVIEPEVSSLSSQKPSVPILNYFIPVPATFFPKICFSIIVPCSF
jgi:hypothetical protein